MLQGLCSRLAQLWATSDLVPAFEAFGTLEAATIM